MTYTSNSLFCTPLWHLSITLSWDDLPTHWPSPGKPDFELLEGTDLELFQCLSLLPRTAPGMWEGLTESLKLQSFFMFQSAKQKEQTVFYGGSRELGENPGKC